MSVGVEVDALALMLNGALMSGARLDRFNVFCLELDDHVVARSSMAKAVIDPEWAEVAEAILELEAWADWWQHETEDDAPFRLSPLALAAHRLASGYASDQILLEAAALLRDGWRPRKRKAGER